ncbi:uncharacterized protein VTP21DRAFT_3440 [Calcarisporiella thermophila]|uniref:uncharacterized protein n=1 Tax=Calcarisporiella thermophila TaxID=911321 RepID=UPI003743CE51
MSTPLYDPSSPITQYHPNSATHDLRPSSLPSSSGSAPVHPRLHPTTYRDLVIFEERLKSNMRRLKKTRKQYEAFLGCLVLTIVYFTWMVFIDPSCNSFLHLLNKSALFCALGSMALFFTLGFYREKISYANKFVPQCNRSLRVFNMLFTVRDDRAEISFTRRVPRRFQEGFEKYRASYRARRRARMKERHQQQQQQQQQQHPHPHQQQPSSQQQ